MRPETRSRGYIGLIGVANQLPTSFNELLYDDVETSLESTNGYQLVQDPVTKQYLMVIDNIRVKNILVTKENVMQQARGISGNLFLSPVAKIKAIENVLINVNNS